eukprot:GHVS01051818.1.p1 GENE.GHVS01051818.1~~GHVS01051818.1.p1  ORF type:complete len:184 (+),score=19.84 GHVS01051818.1:141-692(+)
MTPHLYSLSLCSRHRASYLWAYVCYQLQSFFEKTWTGSNEGVNRAKVAVWQVSEDNKLNPGGVANSLTLHDEGDKTVVYVPEGDGSNSTAYEVRDVKVSESEWNVIKLELICESLEAITDCSSESSSHKKIKLPIREHKKIRGTMTFNRSDPPQLQLCQHMLSAVVCVQSIVNGNTLQVVSKF